MEGLTLYFDPGADEPRAVDEDSSIALLLGVDDESLAEKEVIESIAGEPLGEGYILFFNTVLFRDAAAPLNPHFEQLVRIHVPFAPQFRGPLLAISTKPFSFSAFLRLAIAKWGEKPPEEEVPEHLVRYMQQVQEMMDEQSH
jgi:hypothetical protein